METKEQILIVYSIKDTINSDIEKAKSAVENFKREGSTVRVCPLTFQIPDGVLPGTTLASELYEKLISSIGAIVFLDDLRPNVAYELGFFHGQGRRVLLVTMKKIEDVWLTISDLAGASIARIENNSLQSDITRYLKRLYDELALVELWDSIKLPNSINNIIKDYKDNINSKYLIESEFGTGLFINEWDPGVNFDIGKNLIQNAKFCIVIKTRKVESKYTIYFKINYSDDTGIKKDIWIGLSSVKRMANLQSDERLVSSKNATNEWTILSGTFIDLFKKSSILGKIEIESLIKMKIRSGADDSPTSSEIEVGFINIYGME